MPAELAGTNEDSTRDQLLDAAEELFIGEGLNGASLRAIGRRAGQRNAVLVLVQQPLLEVGVDSHRPIRCARAVKKMPLGLLAGIDARFSKLRVS